MADDFQITRALEKDSLSTKKRFIDTKRKKINLHTCVNTNSYPAVNIVIKYKKRTEKTCPEHMNQQKKIAVEFTCNYGYNRSRTKVESAHLTIIFRLVEQWGQRGNSGSSNFFGVASLKHERNRKLICFFFWQVLKRKEAYIRSIITFLENGKSNLLGEKNN